MIAPRHDRGIPHALLHRDPRPELILQMVGQVLKALEERIREQWIARLGGKHARAVERQAGLQPRECLAQPIHQPG